MEFLLPFVRASRAPVITSHERFQADESGFGF
jgi:hypothetical protein